MNERLTASFRDPSGFLFTQDGLLYRQVNQLYGSQYEQLMDTGLYRKLVKKGLLIPHTEVEMAPAEPEIAFKVLQPEPIPFISYPYEWSFSQLKTAALTTLTIQKLALAAGMSLKDASAYNIQFHQGRPLLIDTLSFELYPEGQPWIAYRQFCQHFLAPLALMAHKDIRLNQLLRIYIDGIPLDLASRLLPWYTRLQPSLLMHLHMHAKAQQRYANEGSEASGEPKKERQLSRTAFIGVIESLSSAIKKLNWQPQGAWTDYYDDTNYSDAATKDKEKLVNRYLNEVQPTTVWDLGANTGHYSRLATQKGVFTVAFDIDPGAVERNYLQTVTDKESMLLPLLMDLTNPSGGLGWFHQERDALLARAADKDGLALALALVHHLAIANNVPLPQVAEFFAAAGRWLIIEFVPKEDSQVQRLLATREDIFPQYTRAGFEAAFATEFTVKQVESVADSARLLYLMERK